MKKVRYLFAVLLGTLIAALECLFNPRKLIALPNELGLVNEHGIETLLVDPADTLPNTGGRYLLYMRGSAYNYAKTCDGTHLPLGPSSDAAYQAGDLINVRRLGCRKGFELGVPDGAIAQDDLIVASTTAGKVKAFTGLADGTYFVVGRCLKAVAATASEVAYQPLTVRKVVIGSSGATFTETWA